MPQHEQNQINYNMRCIETEIDTSGLTKKSDKLQHEMY